MILMTDTVYQGMGRFPLVPVACHEKKLPEEVTSRGGYIIVSFQLQGGWDETEPEVKVFAANVSTRSLVAQV